MVDVWAPFEWLSKGWSTYVELHLHRPDFSFSQGVYTIFSFSVTVFS